MSLELNELNQLWTWLDKSLRFPEQEKTKEMLLLMLDALFLFSRKQNDYTSMNIALGGEEGVFIRITDKWARLFSHYRLGKQLQNESIEDTWMDLAVYSLIALLVRRGLWKPTEEEIRALGLWGEENHLSRH